MKKIVVTILLLGVAWLVSFFVLGRMSGSGSPPGLTAGRLAPCPDTPNCVSSEPGTDPEHFVEPIPMSAFPAGKITSAVVQAVREMGGEIVSQEEGYLGAVFTSGFFGFTDDFEIRIDREADQVHVRSASRVGYSDLGANHKRVAAFKKVFMASGRTGQ